MGRAYVEEQVVSTGIYFAKDGDTIDSIHYSREDAENRVMDIKSEKQKEHNKGE